MNFVNNMATVQFDHRLLAWTLLALVPIWWWRIRATPALPAAARRAAHLLLAMLLIQVTLGIATLLLVVPLPLAALHQSGAVLLFAAALQCRARSAPSSRERRFAFGGVWRDDGHPAAYRAARLKARP